jgi:hypothetical protein
MLPQVVDRKVRYARTFEGCLPSSFNRGDRLVWSMRTRKDKRTLRCLFLLPRPQDIASVFGEGNRFRWRNFQFDGLKLRRTVGCPKVDQQTERLLVLMARENPSWGYDRIAGALANLGHRLSGQTVGNIRGRHGISPAPKRKQSVSLKKFIREHRDVLVGTDAALTPAQTNTNVQWTLSHDVGYRHILDRGNHVPQN